MKFKLGTPTLTKMALFMITVVGLIIIVAYLLFPKTFSAVSPEDITMRLKQSASLDNEAVEYLGIDIEVRKDGSAIITAAARVQASLNQIVYGISFGIPLTHFRPDGSLGTHTFNIIKGFRNGDPVATTSFTSGSHLERVYLGGIKEAKKLQPGEHSFQLLYKLDDIIDYTEKYDSITALDLIGTYWKVPIKSATVALRFPSEFPLAKVEHSAVIQNYRGSTTAASSRLDNENQSIQFWAPVELDPLNGLSISARWPAGHIARVGRDVFVDPATIDASSQTPDTN